MIEALSIADTTPLPAAPVGWFDYGYAPLMDGNLAFIRTRTDFHTEYELWWEAVNSGDQSHRFPDLGDEIQLSVFDGVVESTVTRVPSCAFPIVDQMSDGRWLVVSGRALEGELNGRIYSRGGREEHAMAVGDGIEHLQCSPDGTFWIGYFDEGVFGGSMRDGRWPVSSGGIVQFESSGRMLWSYNDQSPKHPVDDCYAMTLSGDELWACFYSDFPIVRLDGVTVTLWTNEIAGGKAIAVEDDIAMLAGSYDDKCQLALIKLELGTSRHLGSLRLDPPERFSRSMVQGRGGVLHVIRNGIWAKVPVRRALEAALPHGTQRDA
jgi:hypothetical protein